MTYIFKCPVCDYCVETPIRDPAPTCLREVCLMERPSLEAVVMVRDYRAENPGIARSAFWIPTQERTRRKDAERRRKDTERKLGLLPS